MKLAHRSIAWLAIIVSTGLTFACGGEDHDDLSNPPAGTGGSGSGGPCTTSASCGGSTPICDELEGVCVQCLFDTQCEAGATCDDRHCVAATTCSSSLDCVDAGDRTICDPVTSMCVECVGAADCTGTAECVANACVPYTSCDDSLDCPPGLVCATPLGRCVECDTKADCDEGQECIANVCKTITACVSDNQCTPLGQLCDKTLGYCVDCLEDGHCPDAYHCAGGSCALDLCQAGASACEGNSIVACSANGDGWGAAQPCVAETTCRATGASAICEPWVCEAGMTYCDGSVLVTCAADGLSVASSMDCSSVGKHCYAGACTDQACSPNALYCEGNDVRQCDAQGSGSSVVDTCTSGEYCDAGTASCKAMVCSPGTPACNGSFATTCNSQGSGYVPGGTDCAAQGKSCENGACATCPAVPGSPSEVRIREVGIGTNDYILLENRGTCAADLNGLTLQIMATAPENQLVFDLPPHVLQPGETVYVQDQAGAQTGDIASVDNIFLTPESGENVILCLGACSSATVVDFFAHASGDSPPAAPFGITFTPGPLTGILTADQDVNSYMRTGFSGSFPAYKSSDYTVAPASRPYVNPNGCPPTQPVTGSSCTLLQQCIYGAVTCLCFNGWICT